MAVVPVIIRPHLVPFFFNESEGEEAAYGNKKVKAVLFSPMVSTIGRIIRLLMVKSGRLQKIENFNMFLTISDTGNGGKGYKGEVYKHESGRNSFLMLPEDASVDINDMLEDLFRMAFISYVSGHVDNNPDGSITATIDTFIDKYDLLEFGFSNDTLRRLYYRERKNNKIISRFQTKKSPNTINVDKRI